MIFETIKIASIIPWYFRREVRLPYLFHELVELVFSLPINYGWSKKILLDSIFGSLHQEITFRKYNKGFQAPSSCFENKRVKELIVESTESLIKEKVAKSPLSFNSWQFLCVIKF